MNRFLFTRCSLWRLTVAAVIAVTLSQSAAPALAQEKRRCLAGVNYPWAAYGHDFGKNQWGHDGIITGGWTYQNIAGSNGFVDTRFSTERAASGTGSLRITADLDKGAGKPAGEVFIALKDHLPPGIALPINVKDTICRFRLWLPENSAGDPSTPSYIQLFFKRELVRVVDGMEVREFPSWYSPARNIARSEEQKWIEVAFDTSSVPSAVDSGYDPTDVSFIGLKIAINDQAENKSTLKGKVYLDDLKLGTNPVLFDFETLEIERDFANLQASIGQCVAPVTRVFLFTDGRASPEFAENGEVTGLDDDFFEDFDRFIAAAKQQKILVIPVLLDFLWFDSPRFEAGVQLGGRSDVIRNSTRRQKFINRVLKPLIERYCNETQILAWDIINEPEWAMLDVPKDPQVGAPPIGEAVTTSEMQEFVKLCADTIHSCATQKATVGSARRVWLHYWQGLGLDLYQFHWYDKFAQASLPDPFPWPPYSELRLDKPCIVGEVPTKSSQHSAQEFLNAAFEGGYEGVLLWSYRASDDFSDFGGSKQALESWCRGTPTLVDKIELAKKKCIISGTCLDWVDSIVINQKLVSADILTITSAQIVAKGKLKKLGIVSGTNELRLRFRSGALSSPFTFEN